MAMSLFSATRSLVLVAFVLSLKLVAVHGQESSSTSTSNGASASPSTTATVFSGTANWDYIGCYNETTLVNGTGGARALAGVLEAEDDMTVVTCLDYCRGQGLSMAGLEYTRYVTLILQLSLVLGFDGIAKLSQWQRFGAAWNDSLRLCLMHTC